MCNQLVQGQRNAGQVRLEMLCSPMQTGIAKHIRSFIYGSQPQIEPRYFLVLQPTICFDVPMLHFLLQPVICCSQGSQHPPPHHPFSPKPAFSRSPSTLTQKSSRFITPFYLELEKSSHRVTYRVCIT